MLTFSEKFLGYIDENNKVSLLAIKENNIYKKLNDNDKEKYGEIDGSRKNITGKFIEFTICQPNTKVKKYEIYKHNLKRGYKLIRLNNNFSINKDNYLNPIELNNYKEEILPNEVFYFCHEGFIYGPVNYCYNEFKSCNDKPFLDAYDYSDNLVFSLPGEGKEYLFGALGERKERPLDFISEEKLKEWFKSKIIELGEISNKNFYENLDAVFDCYKGEIEEEFAESRFRRIRSLIESSRRNYLGFQEYVRLVENIIEEKYNNQNNSNLSIEQTISDLRQKKEKLEVKIKKLNNDYEEQLNANRVAIEKELNETNNKLEAVKSDYFKVLKDILGDLNNNSVSKKRLIVLHAFEKTDKKFDAQNDIQEICERNLKDGCNQNIDNLWLMVKNYFNKDSELFTHKAIFIPSVSWAYIYGKAIRNCKIFITHVEYDWLHYNDFYHNGIEDVLDSCIQNPDVNNILVFDTLNIVQPESALSLFFDTIAGINPLVPGANILFPNNLKIMATIQSSQPKPDNIGLPLKEETFSKWGFVGEPGAKIPLPKDFFKTGEKAEGFYFTTQNINELLKDKASENGESYYEF